MSKRILIDLDEELLKKVDSMAVKYRRKRKQMCQIIIGDALANYDPGDTT